VDGSAAVGKLTVAPGSSGRRSAGAAGGEGDDVSVAGSAPGGEGPVGEDAVS